MLWMRTMIGARGISNLIAPLRRQLSGAVLLMSLRLAVASRQSYAARTHEQFALGTRGGRPRAPSATTPVIGVASGMLKDMDGRRSFVRINGSPAAVCEWAPRVRVGVKLNALTLTNTLNRVLRRPALASINSSQTYRCKLMRRNVGSK